MIKFCNICQQNNSKDYGCVSGYFWGLKDDITICPIDENTLINIDFPAIDLRDLRNISTDPTFIKSMIDLYQTDIIEYQLKMSQFRSQVQQQEQIKQQLDNSLKCPYCGSTNVKKITTTSKIGSAAVWGIFAVGKITKNYHCKNCKSDF